jgi:hypothetical protein
MLMVVMVSASTRNALVADAFLTGISGAAAAANVRFRAELAARTSTTKRTRRSEINRVDFGMSGGMSG